MKNTLNYLLLLSILSALICCSRTIPKRQLSPKSCWIVEEVVFKDDLADKVKFYKQSHFDTAHCLFCFNENKRYYLSFNILLTSQTDILWGTRPMFAFEGVEKLAKTEPMYYGLFSPISYKPVIDDSYWVRTQKNYSWVNAMEVVLGEEKSLITMEKGVLTIENKAIKVRLNKYAVKNKAKK